MYRVHLKCRFYKTERNYFKNEKTKKLKQSKQQKLFNKFVSMHITKTHPFVSRYIYIQNNEKCGNKNKTSLCSLFVVLNETFITIKSFSIYIIENWSYEMNANNNNNYISNCG